DVWQDPDYEFAESKSERLLLAGIDFLIHRFVGFVAGRAPRLIFKKIGMRGGGAVVFISVGRVFAGWCEVVRVGYVFSGVTQGEGTTSERLRRIICGDGDARNVWAGGLRLRGC